jgi:hypothetical protein
MINENEDEKKKQRERIKYKDKENGIDNTFCLFVFFSFLRNVKIIIIFIKN